MKIPESEVIRVRKNMRRMNEFSEQFVKLPEAQHQAILFRSWVALASINFPIDKPYLYWCPKCRKMEELKLECGLGIENAIDLLAEEIPKHAEKVKEAQKRIGLKLRLIPFPRNQKK